MATKDVLRAHDLQAGYGSAQVLFGAGLRVGAGEAVALLGRNGMGKSTLIRSILGFTRVTGGRVEVNGRDGPGWPRHRSGRGGIGWVAGGRQVFASVAVPENLMVSARLARRQGLW